MERSTPYPHHQRRQGYQREKKCLFRHSGIFFVTDVGTLFAHSNERNLQMGERKGPLRRFFARYVWRKRIWSVNWSAYARKVAHVQGVPIDEGTFSHQIWCFLDSRRNNMLLESGLDDRCLQVSPNEYILDAFHRQNVGQIQIFRKIFLIAVKSCHWKCSKGKLWCKTQQTPVEKSRTLAKMESQNESIVVLFCRVVTQFLPRGWIYPYWISSSQATGLIWRDMKNPSYDWRSLCFTTNVHLWGGTRGAGE